MIYREFAIKNLEGGVQDPHQDAQELAHEAQFLEPLPTSLTKMPDSAQRSPRLAALGI